MNLTEEQINKFVDDFKKVVNAVAKVIKEIVIPAFKNIFNWLYKNRKYLTGYKKLYKTQQLKYYESISAGKSNNWRKMHDLHLIRNYC